MVHLQLLVALTAQRLWALNLHTAREGKKCKNWEEELLPEEEREGWPCPSARKKGLPSQERPWDVTPGRASRQTLQKVGRAWEQAYQLCMPEKCSMLNWEAWSRAQQLGAAAMESTPPPAWAASGTLICPRLIERLNPRYPTWALPAETPLQDHLIDFPFLDRLQGPDPVLHLLPVLCTKDEFSEWGDHLREGRQKSPADAVADTNSSHLCFLSWPVVGPDEKPPSPGDL